VSAQVLAFFTNVSEKAQTVMLMLIMFLNFTYDILTNYVIRCMIFLLLKCFFAQTFSQSGLFCESICTFFGGGLKQMNLERKYKIENKWKFSKL